MIRLQSINNLPTAAHEIAHIISKRLFGGMKSRELRAAIGQPAVVNELVARQGALRQHQALCRLARRKAFPNWCACGSRPTMPPGRPGGREMV